MSFIPDRERFLELAKEGNLIPIYKEYIADQETPVSAYERVRAALRERDSATHTFLLESVEGGENLARYSFMGGSPRAVIRAYGRRVVIEDQAGEYILEDVDPLESLKEYMGRFEPVEVDGLPLFTGGAVGFMGYEIIQQFEDVPVSVEDDLKAPDMVFMVSDTIIVFDRVRHTLKIVANVYVQDDPKQSYEQALERIDWLAEALSRDVDHIQLDVNKPREDIEPESNFEKAEFNEAVESIKERICAGDVIQTVISQRFETQNQSDSLDVYRALRSINPSPYMFCLDMGESSLVGSSPEVHVRCENRRAEVRPIAGTRLRGKDSEEDERLERELLADPKERAEHIMLVDLARNDLGRVCDYSTIEVAELMTIERYSHVMHIVSDVTGKLREDCDGYELIRATFPAGTVSGAPKIKAMEIIAELEKVKRGPYSGVVGYFDFRGNLDTCITIRTIILDEDKAYVQAGAGIVADSVPEREYEETRNKARGMFKALALAREYTNRRRSR